MNTRSTTSISSLGKLPPQAIEAEEAVLGALLLEKDALMNVIDFLKPEMFYRDSHQKVYNAIYKLFQKGSAIDIVIVTRALRSSGELEDVGGAYAITSLTDRVASSANIEFHARIIQQSYLAREVIRICSDGVSNAYDDTNDVLELLGSLQSKIHGISADHNSKQSSHISSLTASRIAEYRIKPKDGLTGIGCTLKNINQITNGWQKSDLIIIAARPAMGKTAFALTLAKDAAIHFNVPVQIFSLEMSSVQLTDRMISSESGIFLDRLLKRVSLTDTDFSNIEKNLEKLNSAPIHIDDTPGITIMQFRSKLIRAKQLHGIGLAVVDYLQLMQGEPGKKESREQVIASISRGLKSTAKELDIPIIALSQLSRALEDRPGNDKRPRLSDLRESGAIEQDADGVIFLYRPEYYGIKPKTGEPSNVGLCEAIFAKYRNGATAMAKLDFNGAFMRFKDWGENTESTPIEKLVQTELDIEDSRFVVKPPSKEDEDDELPF